MLPRNCFRSTAFRLSPSRALLTARQGSSAPAFPTLLTVSSRHTPQRRWDSNNAQNRPKPEEKDAKKNVNDIESGTVHNSPAESVAAGSTESTTRPGSIFATAAETSEVDSLNENEVPHIVQARQKFGGALQHRVTRKRPSLGVGYPKPNETIFVGNIFFDVTADDLRTQMEKYGTVEHATIICDNRGMSKGYGYVTFDSVESATRAIEGMHLQIFEGRNVYVDYSLVHKREQPNQLKARPTKTLYISNLGYEMTDRDLNELFRDIENIVDIRITVNRRTGQLRGYIHVEFLDTNSSQMAVEALSRKAPYGRKLLIEYSNSKVFGQDDSTLPGIPRLRPSAE